MGVRLEATIATRTERAPAIKRREGRENRGARDLAVAGRPGHVGVRCAAPVRSVWPALSCRRRAALHAA
eukprot:12005697-Alexandrium_andersonii.AAC.1